MKFFTKNFKYRNSKRAFTLIEMMVAVSIFSIVMTISMGALLNIIAINRKSQSVKTIMNNLSFAIEAMARDIRFGTDYNDNGATGKLSFQFKGIHYGVKDTASKEISYYLTDNDVGNCDSDASNKLVKEVQNAGVNDITAPEACIRNLSFYVVGAPKDDSTQPRVLILLNGYAGSGNTKTDFNLQVSVSQRQLDL